MKTQATGWSLALLICSSCVIQTLAYAQPSSEFVPARGPQLPSVRIERKFAEKPNAMKKVALDEIDDIQTNQIQDGGFSWSNFLGESTGKNSNQFYPQKTPKIFLIVDKFCIPTI